MRFQSSQALTSPVLPYVHKFEWVEANGAEFAQPLGFDAPLDLLRLKQEAELQEVPSQAQGEHRMKYPYLKARQGTNRAMRTLVHSQCHVKGHERMFTRNSSKATYLRTL